MQSVVRIKRGKFPSVRGKTALLPIYLLLSQRRCAAATTPRRIRRAATMVPLFAVAAVDGGATHRAAKIAGPSFLEATTYDVPMAKNDSNYNIVATAIHRASKRAVLQ